MNTFVNIGKNHLILNPFYYGSSNVILYTLTSTKIFIAKVSPLKNMPASCPNLKVSDEYSIREPKP